jgi:hypothetical protein
MISEVLLQYARFLPRFAPRSRPAGGSNQQDNQQRVLYSAGGGAGTYFYDVWTRCPQDTKGYKDTDKYPACSTNKGPNHKTLRELGTNNAVAIDVRLLGKNKEALCGKKVIVYYHGKQVRRRVRTISAIRGIYMHGVGAGFPVKPRARQPVSRSPAAPIPSSSFIPDAYVYVGLLYFVRHVRRGGVGSRFHVHTVAPRKYRRRRDGRSSNPSTVHYKQEALMLVYMFAVQSRNCGVSRKLAETNEAPANLTVQEEHAYGNLSH